MREMREAMVEVDRDKSNNIDFYEYLKIVEMIIKKKGWYKAISVLNQ